LPEERLTAEFNDDSVQELTPDLVGPSITKNVGIILHLVVEIKGYRREDAKEKKATMETYWVPGVNNLKRYGRWASAELTDAYQIESDFRARIEAEFDRMVSGFAS
jgi:hypothetical protein